jgi:hypothetical protein
MSEGKFKWAGVLIILIIVFLGTYGILGRQSNAVSPKQHDLKEERERKERKLKEDSDNLPVVDYELLLPNNSPKQDLKQQIIRYARNARYDGYPKIVKDEDGEEVILHTHSMGDFPSIPTQKSNAVIIGVVTDTRAFLSNNKSIVYTEYTVQIKEVLKGGDQSLVGTAEFLTFERLGGAVHFPSGRTRKFREYSFGTPIKGHEYVFFLTYNDVGHSFSLLTAYELSNGRAIALDNGARFSEFKDVPAEVVLDIVRESMK